MRVEAPGEVAAPPGRIGAHGMSGPGRGRRLRRWWPLGALLVVAGAAALASYLLRPRVSVTPGGEQLASLSTGPGTTITSATARVAGRAVALADRGGVLQVSSPIPPGAPVEVTVTARSPWWESWWAGSRIEKTVSVPAPSAELSVPVVRFAPGGAPTLRFTRPVRQVRWTYDGATHTRRLGAPSRTVTVELPSGHGTYGVVQVAAAPYLWETLPQPTPLTFFQGNGNLAEVTPSGGDPSPTAPITMVFSRRVSTLFGGRRPTVGVALLDTRPAGRWTSPNPYTLAFQPSPGALWPGQDLQVHLPVPVGVNGAAPARTVSFPVAQGSVTRLQQELAVLGYLPFNWTPAPGAAGPPTSVSAAQAAAYLTPDGNFTWRWAPPARLAGLWQPGQDNVMTQAAVKAFEHVSGLATVGESNPLLWPYLAKALAAGKANPNGYTWVDISKTLPETLTVWHDGKPVISSPTNTGIAQDPTADGTFIVYLRYKSQIMRGTNPDGSHYADPVKWVSYFNGSDAIHGFVRASYGYPQSLGCAELPYATAQQVYPYTPIGTLVTVH